MTWKLEWTPVLLADSTTSPLLATPVAKCSVCKALILHEDQDSHELWHDNLDNHIHIDLED
jgi:hypothetical protein